jgi:hypothetical protein
MRDARPDGAHVDAGADAGSGGCPREAAPADRSRKVVVSHPFDSDSNPDNRYRVLELSSEGELSDSGTVFRMGRSTGGEIAFTPDGRIGIAPQEDGTLGVFRFDDQGEPVVVHDRFDREFLYASRVVMGPRGDRVWILDTEFEDVGGGLYRAWIGCDGRLSGVDKILPAQLAYHLKTLGDGRAVLAAKGVSGEVGSSDAYLLDGWDGTPEVLDQADAFGDDEAIMNSTAVTSDGQFMLIGDNGELSDPPNRIAIAAIGQDSLSPVQVISDFRDPNELIASPFGDLVLAVSGYRDAIFALNYAPDGGDEPFSVRGELDYEGPRPRLPGEAVMVRRGPLEGLVLVVQTSEVRRLRFEGGGEVTDLGAFDLGDGVGSLTRAIGVQP